MTRVLTLGEITQPDGQIGEGEIAIASTHRAERRIRVVHGLGVCQTVFQA